MPRRVRCEAGRLAIYDSEVPAAFDDPLDNMGAVYFHSDLAHMRVVYDVTRTINFPIRNIGAANFNPSALYRHDVFPAHNLGHRPNAVLRIANRQVPTLSPVGSVISDRLRFLALEVTPTDFYIQEVVCSRGTNVPADSVTLRVVAYAVAPAGAGNSRLADFDAPSGRLRLGYGKFDTDLRYLRVVEEGATDFWMTRGRTADSRYGAIRLASPNGSATDIGSYVGSFDGGPFYGVRD